MTKTPDANWDQFSDELADRIEDLYQMRADTLRDIADMGAEIKRIEALRVQWIQRARDLGVTAQEVGDAASISRQQVYRITNQKNGSKS